MNDLISKTNELLEYQPGLILTQANVLEGKLYVNRQYDSFWVNREFQVKIELNEENVFFSKVYDVEGYVKRTYPHINPRGNFCLATEIDLLWSSIKTDSLVAFCRDFIEPFLFSYEYYKSYGIYPFDDRTHADKGVLESYMEITQIYDEHKLLDFLRTLIKNTSQYGNHAFCPCGSGKKIRACHMSFVQMLLHKPFFNQVKKDVGVIEKYVKHKRTTK